MWRELQALAQQSERHVHARDRGAQLMRGAQDKLAAHALEGTLLGDVVQHHDCAENLPVGVADRGQAVSQ
ncbi:hypothetical protein D3C75_1120720 [compost metagenome]